MSKASGLENVIFEEHTKEKLCEFHLRVSERASVQPKPRWRSGSQTLHEVLFRDDTIFLLFFEMASKPYTESDEYLYD